MSRAPYMSSKTKSATAQKSMEAMPSIGQISQKLGQAATFLKEHREAIFRKPPVSMSQSVVIASFVMLKRMGAMLDRRLSGKNGVRERINEIVAMKLPEMKPGEKEQRLPAQGFGVAIIRVNKAANRRVINRNVLEELLESKKIKASTVTVVPVAPPAYYSEHLVQQLVAQGKLTTKEYESVMEFAKPEPELHVEVPSELDAIINCNVFMS